MAALQKIRSHGVLLVTIIAIALFLFVMGDLVRGGEGLFNSSKQQVGEVLGENLSIQDYNDMVNDLQNYYEIMGQPANGEEAQNRVKDEAWQQFVQTQLIADECEKLGLRVTDQEVANVIQTGQSQYLQVAVFQGQNGYDFGSVQNFLSEYKKLKESGNQVPEQYEKVYKYYLFAQRQIRNELLMAKYQTLISAVTTANKVSAQMAFNDRVNTKDLQVANLPFNLVADDKVKVEESDLKAKYDELVGKKMLELPTETRDVKYISVVVEASDADKAASKKEIETACQKLSEVSAEDVGNVVRQYTSLVSYSNVLKSKDAFGTLIANALDSISSGVYPATYDAQNNCYYTYRVIATATQPDSVLFRQLAVGDPDEKKAQERADSVVTALNAGATFADVAKKYNQQSDSSWVTTAQYERATLDADNAKFISTIFSTGAGQTTQVKLSNGNIVILQILDTRKPVLKYNVAAIVKDGEYSNETRKDVYNKFSSFLAKNKTLADIEKNAAKEGYAVVPMQNISSSAHGIANITGSRDALKWAFDEADINDVSTLYECGNNGNNLLVVALTGVNKAGTVAYEKVKDDFIRPQVLNEKKAEYLLGQLKNAKTLADAQKIQGCTLDSVNGVSFAANQVGEPMISAISSKTKVGATSKAFKGNNGVYMLQVVKENKDATAKFDEKAEKQQAVGMLQNNVYRSILDVLYKKANVQDNRYKFF